TLPAYCVRHRAERFCSARDPCSARCRTTPEAGTSQLNGDALARNFASGADRAFARSISPDCKHDEQKIKNDKGCDVRFAADTESVTMEPFAQNKVHAIPRH